MGRDDVACEKEAGFRPIEIFSLFMIHPAEAAVDPVEEIREMVTPEFMTYTSGSLRPVKDDYGITDTEDVQLGEGHPYYIVSSEFLKSSSAMGGTQAMIFLNTAGIYLVWRRTANR